jgi:hypothetical protein
MDAFEKIRMSTSALYDDGRGITDGPTRGLMHELLFYDLVSQEVRKRLTKGTFQKQSYKSNNGRNAKYQYDWLLLKKPVTEISSRLKSLNITLSGIPFGSYNEDDILAVIEIKTGTAEVHRKNITDSSSFWSYNQKKSLGMPWVYIAFCGIDELRKKSLPNGYSPPNLATEGKYFCLWGKKGDQAMATHEGIDGVNKYLESLI